MKARAWLVLTLLEYVWRARIVIGKQLIRWGTRVGGWRRVVYHHARAKRDAGWRLEID